MQKLARATFKLLDLLIIFMMVFGSPLSALAAPLTQDPVPTITSDKADYAPGETVTLTGAGWQSGESVHIFVNDDVDQLWSHDSNPDPVADDAGSFTYQFDLPDLFVAMYSVTATGETSGIATTTFTDAIPNNVSMLTWRTSGAGAWIQGTLNANNSNYKEGETVPFRIELGTLATSGNPYSAAICRDYQTGTVFGYTQLLPFNTSRAATPGGTITSSSAAGAWPAGTFQGVNLTITGVTETGAPGACGSTQRETIVTFNASASGPQYLLWGGRLSSPTDPGVGFGNSASFYPGGSLQMRLQSPDKTAGINPGGIIQLAKITVTKVVDSGSATPDQWCFTVTGPNGYNSTLCVPGGQSSVDFIGLESGSYTVTESNVAGYSFVSGSGTNCTFSGSTATATVAAAAGGATNASCTFHNAIQASTLTLVKTVVNDNGGTAVADDFQAYIDGNAVDWGVAQSVSPGSHTASEDVVAGYTASAWGGDCAADGSVSLSAGQNKTCTITNDDQAAHLTLVKEVINDNGGSAAAADFTLSADGPTPISGAGGADSDVSAGTYDLSETGPSGYSASDWSCVGGSQNGASVTVANGESATCTITNDDQAAHLTLVKEVINDNGGSAAAADFTLSADGPTPISGAGGADSDVSAGTYDLSETNVAGYTASDWSCIGGSQNGSSITLANGESATCTITNDDQQAYVIVEKVVINDNGGSANPDDFLLTLDGNAATSGIPIPVNPGTYTAGETQLDGYTFEGFSGDCDDNGSVTVALGETKTCTLTNNDEQAYVIVEKVVINDNGGSANPDDFLLTLDGNATTSGTAIPVNPGTYTAGETQLSGYTFEGFSGDCDDNGDITVALGETKSCTLTNNDQQAYITVVKVVNNNSGGTAAPNDFNLTLEGNAVSSGVAVPVNPGTYTAGETLLSGYSFVGFSGDCDSSGDVTVALGQSKTCTLTNDDIAPSLTLNKIVVNNNGGTAAESAWTLTANGGSAGTLSGPGAAGNADVVSGSTFKAGTYALSESAGPSGYSASSWSCVKNGGSPVTGSSITLGLGDSATCTITNDDIAPSLTLNKIVVNDNGGTATESAWTLTANGGSAGTLSGAGAAGNADVVSGSTFKAGTYALSESTGPFGYTAGSWSCVKNGGSPVTGSSITLGVGDSATCSITNNDQPGTIIVKKIIKPEGSPTSFSFDATGTGYNDFSLAANQTNSQTLNAGSYSVKELVPLGWVLTGIGGSTDPNTPYNCTVTGSGGSTGVGDLSTQTATINLKNGDTVTCVFENTGQGATRTQGFWATHLALAKIAWEGGTAFGHTFPGVASVAGIGDTLICGRDVDALGMTAGSNQLMGGFWSDISKKSNGAKRSALDQARMQLLQQLLAAELNASAFGSVPTSGSFSAWESALCGTNQSAINTAKQQAASFNTAGDSTTFTPGTSADSRTGRFVADIPFWDIIKP